jgi:hypothetical protein
MALTRGDIVRAFEECYQPLFRDLEKRLDAIERDLHETRTGRPLLYNAEVRASILAEIDKYLENPDSAAGRKFITSPFTFGGSYHTVTVEVR